MSSIFNSRRRSGFTLIELLVVIAIIAILAAILFPVFAKARAKARQASGASNQKQIALAFLQYIQDYDEKFPPTYGFNGTYFQHWGVDYTVGSTTVPALLSSYTKSTQLFVDPSGPRPASGGTIADYMYNDLLAGKSQAAVAAVSSTVLTCDSNGSTPTATETFGTAGTSTPTGDSTSSTSVLAAGHAALDSAGAVAYSSPVFAGAATQPHDAVTFDQITRHSDGANFSYSDGHVKWAKITFNGTLPQTIYFPAQTNASTSAATNGTTTVSIGVNEPVPGGNMLGYAGTFHLN